MDSNEFDVSFIHCDRSPLLQKVDHNRKAMLTVDLSNCADEFTFFERPADNPSLLTNSWPCFRLNIQSVFRQQANFKQIADKDFRFRDI